MTRKQQPTQEIIHLAALHLEGYSAMMASRGRPSANNIRRATALLGEALDMGFCYVPAKDIPKIRDLVSRCGNDLPPGLFLGGKGTLEDILNNLDIRTLAVVGTRNITYYGRSVVKQRLQGVTDTAIVTGFGLGIADTAMKEAFDRGLPVIAVPGTGPGDCYPYAMRGSLEIILDTPGCAVVTPFFPHSEPTPFNFLYRNRIVAALADETFVAETKMKGGAMITARLSRSFGKAVTAAPGRIDDIASHGCNQLIAEGTADIWIPWTASQWKTETTTTNNPHEE